MDINPNVRRQTDRRQVYRYLYDDPLPVEAQEIADALFLDLSVVNESLSSLLKEGMISRGPDQAYVLEPMGRIAVGVSIREDGFRLLAVGMRGEELACQEFPEAFSHTQAYYETLSQCLELFLDEFGLDRKRLLGVGIALPGVIDQTAGKLIVAPALELWDVPLEEIYRHFSLYPVYIESSTSASGYAERWADPTRGNLVYLSLDRSVGGSLILEGRQYMGNHGRGGEFGHLRVVPDGRLCSCGRRGCLEAYCSTSRLSDDLGLTLDQFFEALQSGDEQAADLWTEYQSRLTDALANLRQCFDCDIVLGGALSRHLGVFLPEIRWELGAKMFFDSDVFFLHLGRCGSNGACIGTALRFIDDFLLTY